MSYNTGPKIVTDGLVLCLDAADRNSYPGTGTTWYDLSGNGHVATLANGPTFTPNNNGAIVCSPTDDFVYLDNTLNMNYITVSVTFKKNSNSGSGDYIIYNKENVWELKSQNNDLAWAVLASNQGWFWYDTGYNITLNEIIKVDLSYDGNYVRTWINGSLYQSYTYPANGTLSQQTTWPKLNARNNGTAQTSYRYGGDHTYYNFSVYNRALSADEIRQNYNATKGRFGL